MSTACELEVLREHRRRKDTKDVYQAEEVLAEKKVSLFFCYFLCMFVDRQMEE
jgi:hypothetical protein